MSYNFCTLGKKDVHRTYLSVDEINRHATGMGATAATIATITALLTSKANAFSRGVYVFVGVNTFAQTIAYALTNHMIKGFDVVYHYECRKMSAWDTDQWVEFTGWALIDITITTRR